MQNVTSHVNISSDNSGMNVVLADFRKCEGQESASEPRGDFKKIFTNYLATIKKEKREAD